MTTIDIAAFAAVISVNLLLLYWNFSRWSKRKPRLQAWALDLSWFSLNWKPREFELAGKGIVLGGLI